MKNKKETKAEVHPKAEVKPETKKPANKKESTSYSRIQSIADTMRAGATGIDDILLKADALYVKRSGRSSNPKETRTNFSFVRSTLLAFGFATESDGKLTLKG
jgi:hypothetical protein